MTSITPLSGIIYSPTQTERAAEGTDVTARQVWQNEESVPQRTQGDNDSCLLLTEKLFPHLREVDEAATARLTQMMDELTAWNSLPDEASDPMG